MITNFAFQLTVASKTTQLVDMTKKLLKERRRGDLEYFEALREQTIVNQPGKEVKMLDIH